MSFEKQQSFYYNSKVLEAIIFALASRLSRGAEDSPLERRLSTTVHEFVVVH